MAKAKTTFFCQNCGTQHAKWMGQCNACNEWNTIVEEVVQKEVARAVAGAFTLFGVPEEPSTAFGSVMWAAQTAMIIIFGGLSFLLLPICNKAK